MESTKKTKKFIKALLIIAAVLLVLALTTGYVYNNVSEKIIDYNVATIEELGSHDRTSLNAAINSRWLFLDAIADVIKQQGITSYEMVPEFLFNEVSRVPSAKKLCLLDEKGNLHANNGVIQYNEAVFNACLASDGYFALRENSDGVILEVRHERLIFGVPLDYTLDGTRFIALTAEMDVNMLKKDLKVDSYNGQGFSSVIDLNGNYVVNVSEKHSFLTFDNYFEDHAAGKYDRFASTDEFRQHLSQLGPNETLTAVYKYEGGKEISVITPLGVADWYFVTSVPVSVFSAQTLSIMRVFVILLVAVIIGVLLTVMFIMRSRRQAAELSIANARAENMEVIEKQNKRLQEQQTALEEALGMAQSASRAKTTFLNNMSHDIRTPMNAIIGFTALAAKHIDDRNAVTGYLGKISQSGEHLMSLINDVLDMSRIESGKMSLNETKESLAEILKGLRNIVQADIAAKQQELFIDAVDVTDEIVICDKLRLNQILINIISNAIKYTQPGGHIALRIIETQSADKSEFAHFEFRIKDNGIGMSEEYLETIFDPFTREKTSTVSGIQGTGLGMAITKNIVEMMGGTISVTSKQHEGSEFVVKLAFKTVEQDDTFVPRKQLTGLRGMVVDDDMNACQSVSQMLRQIGMRAEWCMYGKEAVARTEEAIRIGDSFEVYIIDWLMPDMNGIETARRIRQVVGEKVPIIILSAYDWADIEDEARKAGVTAFVSKTLFKSDLHRALSAAYDDKPETQSAVSEELNFAGKRILLVEDNELNREIALEVLEEVGFEVDEAEDGTVAVEKMKVASPGQYAVILMDIQMPIMDGYEATRKIRALPEAYRSMVPIVAMTANALEDDKKKAFETGMNGHVAKPIELDKLFKTLKDILK